ncbi:IS110 family transposase, partial [Gammaproteobacteria bacterium]|nr:IS110 family transposase [Gammaproteobacteria bacterium]
LGHEALLIPPAKVKPFVQGNKNDANDAVAIAEAAQRPNIHPVPIKPLDEQQLQSLVKVRQRRIRQRTALINQIRGLLAEQGVICGSGRQTLMTKLPGILADDDGVLGPAGVMFLDLKEELHQMDESVERIDRQLHDMSQINEQVKQAQTVPGVGVVTSAIVVGAFGNARRFDNGRQFAACIGLTPRHHASGERMHIGSITKHGNTMVRTMLIHGARSVMRHSTGKDDPLSRWVQRLVQRKPRAVAIVALANKLARILWAVLSSGQPYQAKRLTLDGASR